MTQAEQIESPAGREAESPYGALLGLKVLDAAEDRVRLELPYREGNTNPGKNLHGGVIASIMNLAARSLTRTVMGPEGDPVRTSSFQVNYLSAPVGQTIYGEARLLRKGRDLCFLQLDVSDAQGKPVANGSAIMVARFGAEAPPIKVAEGDGGQSDSGFLGKMHTIVPFFKTLGLRVENVSCGSSRVRLGYQDHLLGGTGEVAEGAILALLDTTGAMAAWIDVKPGPYRSATVGLNARVFRTVSEGEGLVAFARPVYRDQELVFTEVQVAQASDRVLVAAGNLVYRMTLPSGIPSS